MVDGDAEGDAPQPNAEPRGIGEQVEVSERAKEGFLRDVVGVRGPNERQGERIHHSLVSTDELPERVVGRRYARSRSVHELAIGLAVSARFRKSQGTAISVGSY